MWLLYDQIILPKLVLNARLHQAKSIGVACKLYASDHKGKYPERLQDLIPDYITDPIVLVFPSADRTRHLDCQYFGGTETDPPRSVLLRIPDDAPRVAGGRCLL